MPTILKQIAIVGFILFVSATHAHASTTLGTIDPNDLGDYLAQLVTDPGLGSDSDEINFGKFTTEYLYNITVSDAGLRGFAWGSTLGWIVTNCADTDSGCSSTNGNFKIAVASDGTLSGYAWGENAGWINFGPFVNSDTEQVKISSLGVFGGQTQSDGYAWSQNYGWIKFDCTSADSCVTTDYIPADYRDTHECSDSIDNDGDGEIDYPDDPGCSSGIDDDETNSSGGGGGGHTYICSDNLDNDGDGKIDYPNDPGCIDSHDEDESNGITPPPVYICSDNLDNDGDGKIDYPNDPGCANAQDMDETNNIVSPPVYICSDGLDNDGDGLIDYGNDPGCASPIDSDEFNVPTIIIDINVDDPGIDNPPDNPPENPPDDNPPIIQPPDGPPERIKPLSFIPKIPDISIPPKVAISFSLGALLLALAIGILSAVLNLPFLFVDLWALILAPFGWRKKRWGIVYDARTKQPIDPAYVILFDIAGKEIATCITDLQGRYGFLVSPGTYTITVQKTHYEFPSKRLAGRDHDAVYEDLYFGEQITITNKEQVILKNIPLDPVAVDWNEVAKRKQGFIGFYGRHEHAFRVLGNAVFMIGFLFAIGSYLISPIVWNLIVVIVYIVVFVLEKVNILKPKTANVVDARNDGLPFALVEIYNAHMNQKIATKVTSAHGRFLGLVPKGQYYAKVLKRDSLDTETYTPVATTGEFDANNGYIEEKFTVDRSE